MLISQILNRQLNGHKLQLKRKVLRLRDMVPEALLKGNIFLGFTSDGEYMVSINVSINIDRQTFQIQHECMISAWKLCFESFKLLEDRSWSFEIPKSNTCDEQFEQPQFFADIQVRKGYLIVHSGYMERINYSPVSENCFHIFDWNKPQSCPVFSWTYCSDIPQSKVNLSLWTSNPKFLIVPLESCLEISPLYAVSISKNLPSFWNKRQMDTCKGGMGYTFQFDVEKWINDKSGVFITMKKYIEKGSKLDSYNFSIQHMCSGVIKLKFVYLFGFKSQFFKLFQFLTIEPNSLNLIHKTNIISSQNLIKYMQANSYCTSCMLDIREHSKISKAQSSLTNRYAILYGKSLTELKHPSAPISVIL